MKRLFLQKKRLTEEEKKEQEMRGTMREVSRQLKDLRRKMEHISPEDGPDGI